MMRCTRELLVGVVLVTQAVSQRGLSAANPSAVSPSPGANAAVIYWQAFAVMPTLEGDAKARYDAAIATTPAAVAEDIRPVVAQFDASLRELDRARGVAPCDWNLNYDDGPGMLLPHLQRARELGRAALLRARLRFAENASNEAVADAVAVMKMARDCGGSPLLVSLLVDIAIEEMATDVVAANLPRLSPEQLDGLTATLGKLPAPTAMVDCMRLEGQIFCDWLERFVDAEAAKGKGHEVGITVFDALISGFGAGCYGAADAPEVAQRRTSFGSLTAADLRESVRLLREDYAELARIAALGPADRRVRAREFEARLGELHESARPEDGEHLFAKELVQLLPAIVKAVEREDRFEVRRQLLTLAIRVQRHGSDAVKNAVIAGHGPIEYRKTDGGFELRCLPAGANKPEVVRVE